MIFLLPTRIIMIPDTALLPQHLLRRRASDLSRGIYASLPWGYRVAGLLVVLAADSLDAFGRVTMAQMILAVVRGLPDVGGKPASDWIQDVYRKGPDVLPPGTGRHFAQKVYKILLSRFSDPEIADEAMSRVMLQATRDKLHVHNGADMKNAESYLITACLNAARDVLRSRSRRREESLNRDHDDEQGTKDVEDPEAFAELDKLLRPSELKGVLQALRDVHPRAPDWLTARLDGDSGQEIAAEWGTTPSYVSKWQRIYVPVIRKVVEHHLRSARVAHRFDSCAWRSGWASG